MSHDFVPHGHLNFLIKTLAPAAAQPALYAKLLTTAGKSQVVADLVRYRPTLNDELRHAYFSTYRKSARLWRFDSQESQTQIDNRLLASLAIPLVPSSNYASQPVPSATPPGGSARVHQARRVATDTVDLMTRLYDIGHYFIEGKRTQYVRSSDVPAIVNFNGPDSWLLAFGDALACERASAAAIQAVQPAAAQSLAPVTFTQARITARAVGQGWNAPSMESGKDSTNQNSAYNIKGPKRDDGSLAPINRNGNLMLTSNQNSPKTMVGYEVTIVHPDGYNEVVLVRFSLKRSRHAHVTFQTTPSRQLVAHVATLLL